MASLQGAIRTVLTVVALGLTTVVQGLTTVALGLATVALGLTSFGLTGTDASASCRLDASRLIYAPSGSDSAQNPAFSPDGTAIVFTEFHSGYNRGASGVFTLSLPAVSVQVLLDEPDHNAVNLPGSAWNGTTNRIVLASDRLDTDEVWTMAPDGTALVRVTQQSVPLLHFQEPSFSPDGQWIVFESVGNGPDLSLRGSIWKIRRDGSSATMLVDGNASDTDNRQPNWSPAGNRILFQRRAGDTDVWNLYTMAVDGSDQVRITTGESDTDGAWSPDGQWIVYSSISGGLSVAKIFGVAAGGGAPVQITFGEIDEDSAPSWSPDGKWIAFESHPPDDRSPATLWRIALQVPFGSCGANGAPCDDANPCTSNDTCQNHICAGTPSDAVACDDGNPCTHDDICTGGACSGNVLPLASCRQPLISLASSLNLRDRDANARDHLSWKWKKGAATTLADLGDPVTTDDYVLCVYDQVAGVDQLVMAHRVRAGEMWQPRSKGFRFRDRQGMEDGIRKVLLKIGDAGKARINVKGSGACLRVAPLPLQQDPLVRVQLSNGSVCWEARYGSNRTNGAGRFKARSD